MRQRDDWGYEGKDEFDTNRNVELQRGNEMRKSKTEQIEALAEVSSELNDEASILRQEARRLTKSARELTKEAEALTETIERLKSQNI